ncbi:MAG: hypothetical protein ACREXU_05245 [Gammaproteobacteria bacterium]
MNELTGAQIARLMRCHHVTIKALARRMNITQKRVRHVRTHGVSGYELVRDWYEGITGQCIPDPNTWLPYPEAGS